MVTFTIDPSVADDDFIANIDAINLLCNLHDDLNIDRSSIRQNLDRLYPEFARRVYGKRDIQQAMPLIKALYRYIYDRGIDNEDRGPQSRIDSLAEMCSAVVAAYREQPLISSFNYLYALSTAAMLRGCTDRSDCLECKEILDSALNEIDSMSVEDRVHYVGAYLKCRHLPIGPEINPKWAEEKMLLNDLDIRFLDDEALLEWCDITEETPLEELNRRAGSSLQMKVAWLQALAFTEFEKESREAAEMSTAKELNLLKDNLIGDIIDTDINIAMSVSTLQAIETALLLRLQLAEVALSDNELTYRRLCKDRRDKIYNVLLEKYPAAESVNEKIAILETIQTIGQSIDLSCLRFAFEEALKLERLSNLTYSQRLRLSWLTDDGSEIDRSMLTTLLRQAENAFDLETIAMIEDMATEEERDTIFCRFAEIFNGALSQNDFRELGKLLVTAAYWNIDPIRRQKLEILTKSVESIAALSLPERRVNAIAATIYTQIATLTQKYDHTA